MSGILRREPRVRRVPLGRLVLLGWAAVAMAAFDSAARGQQGYRVAFATYFGGSQAEQTREVLPLPDGTLVIAGQTDSPDLPVTPGVFQPAYGGEPAGTGHPGIYGGDCFIGRLSADGGTLLAGTYFGGSKQERNVYGLAVDVRGDVVITSTTRSPDLPTTPGAAQRTYGGGDSDIFAAKLSGDLRELRWCTYIGGSGTETPRGGLTTDARDNVYLVGTTASADFPTTPGAYQRAARGGGDALVVKLDPAGRRVWSTLLGGGGSDGIMAAGVDAEGSVRVAGHTESGDLPVSDGAPQRTLGGQSDLFLAGLSPDGSRLLYATYLGGAGNEFAEHLLAVRADGTTVISGTTASPDFPTTAGAYQRDRRGPGDGIVAALSSEGRRLAFATLLGGGGGENLFTPRLGPDGNLYVAGSTTSTDLPVTPDALQKTSGGGQDAVIAIFSPDGARLLYCSYLGGSGEEVIRQITLGPEGEIFLAGQTTSADFPVSPGAFQRTLRGPQDGFIVKLVSAGGGR